ncbi:MAG: thioredoxin domain-containing protein [Ignavibacteria bacterium]|nr:thioredoxin domain-containing protein [Ignavibacteria bacterium]
MYTNRLINEKSPYLLQHAKNPVDWYPWCDEAFERAKQEDKPIFLSIGYSSCHWCHVMERESFDDPEIARILNDVFVCIKVDKEERPDLDAFYMKVCQIMTGSGGWPLTIIMTPDKKPFFAGTYFPKESYPNRIGLKDLAINVQRIWRERRFDVENSANNLLNYISTMEKDLTEKKLDNDYLLSVYNSLEFSYDRIYGGFSPAPKFPTPQNLLFLLDYFVLTGNEFALEMVTNTLTKMRLGGIFDQIGFGFHRYSTDGKWLLPHFEKMLYDQGMLLYTYSQAYRITRNKFFFDVASEIVEYVLRDLLFENKAFFTSEDADSEGEEGKYYLFEYEELEELLQSDFELFSKIYNINVKGNFSHFFERNEGKNILFLNKPLEEIANEIGFSEEDLIEKIESFRSKLFDYRSQRTKPFKDTKILSDWNGLMIAGLANFLSISQREDISQILFNYLSFFRENVLKSDGTIFHMFMDGESRVEGLLDDYAYNIFGFVEAFKNTYNQEFLVQAQKLLDKSIELFWNNKDGVFYLSKYESDNNFLNTYELFDGAIPSGNSVMFYNLNQLYLFSGETKYKEISKKLEGSFSKYCADNPTAYNFFNFALQRSLKHKFEVVVVYSEVMDELYKKIKELFQNTYIPNGLVIFSQKNRKENLDFPYWSNYQLKEGKTTVYLCSNFSCSEPITNFEIFIKEFNKIVQGD